MVKALDKCSNDYQCVAKQMDQSEKSNILGFKRFNNHIAELEMTIKNY